MSERLAVILASSDLRVLEAGMMYAGNAAKKGWMEDTKLFLFGPSETQIATDPRLQDRLREILASGMIPVACKACSDEAGISDRLAELGCDVEYVGEPISRAIRDGYVPMVW